MNARTPESDLSPQRTTSGPAPSTRWQIIVWGCVFVVVAGALYAHVAAPLDADTDYHFAVARLTRAHGILRAFPWTPFSWLADHYADKELGFHLLLATLATKSLAAASQLAGTILGAGLLLVLYLVLRAERVRFAGLWALVPLVASELFLYRFLLVRPHLVSIALALLVLWAATRERLVVLGIAAALYPWMYVAWQLPLVLVGMAEGARLLAGERPRWKPALVAAGGILVGVALHPNGLNLVRLAWIQIGEALLKNSWGNSPSFELGEELRAPTLLEWGKYLAGGLAATLGAAALAWRRRRDDPVAVAFTLAAIAFGLLTARSGRFAEYFIPFAIAALALASRGIHRQYWPAAAFGALVLYGAPGGVSLWRNISAFRKYEIPAAMAETLQARIPQGAQVFTCGWVYTGTMMLALPERRFVVALDPTFFYVRDPALYELWFDVPRQPPPHAAEVIREKFGARFVLCRWDNRFRDFFWQLAFEPGAQTIAMANGWTAYDLGPPRQPAPAGALPGP